MDTLEAIRARKDVRKFKSEPIPEQKLQVVLGAMRLAPSAKNLQPWKFMIVRDESVKRKLACACNNQKYIVDCPVIVVGCAIVSEAYPYLGAYMSSYPVDVAAALDHLALAAVSEGLGTCWIYEFSEEKVKETLDISHGGDDLKVVALMAIGFPDESPEPQGRKNLSEITHYM